MIMPAPSDALCIAAFAAEGGLVGTRRWRLSDLSPEWVGVCRRILHENGSSFRVSLGRPIEHIEVKFTSAAGSAMGTFFANGEIVISSACVCGLAEGKDREVLGLFQQSLLRVPLVHSAPSGSARAFQSLFFLSERPRSEERRVGK